jgi:hypothetical protein
MILGLEENENGAHLSNVEAVKDFQKEVMMNLVGGNTGSLTWVARGRKSTRFWRGQ